MVKDHLTANSCSSWQADCFQTDTIKQDKNVWFPVPAFSTENSSQPLFGNLTFTTVKQASAVDLYLTVNSHSSCLNLTEQIQIYLSCSKMPRQEWQNFTRFDGFLTIWIAWPPIFYFKWSRTALIWTKTRSNGHRPHWQWMKMVLWTKTRWNGHGQYFLLCCRCLLSSEAIVISCKFKIWASICSPVIYLIASCLPE